MRETTLNIFGEFGGAVGIASLVRQAFEQSPPGSAAQASIFKMILTGLERYGEEDIDEDEISIEALEKQMYESFMDDLMLRLPPNLAKSVKRALA